MPGAPASNASPSIAGISPISCALAGRRDCRQIATPVRTKLRRSIERSANVGRDQLEGAWCWPGSDMRDNLESRQLLRSRRKRASSTERRTQTQRQVASRSTTHDPVERFRGVRYPPKPMRSRRRAPTCLNGTRKSLSVVEKLVEGDASPEREAAGYYWPCHALARSDCRLEGVADRFSGRERHHADSTTASNPKPTNNLRRTNQPIRPPS